MMCCAFYLLLVRAVYKGYGNYCIYTGGHQITSDCLKAFPSQFSYLNHQKSGRPFLTPSASILLIYYTGPHLLLLLRVNTPSQQKHVTNILSEITSMGK